MCGIAGFIDKAKTVQDLEKMTACIRRRGPDDSGVFFENGVALGHRRLSIIDLSAAGHQPMHFESLVIIFNGEIYNYREVQKELIKEGYSFTSSSDTEVVIKAFHRWGSDCVNRFIGMFAIAIYNKREKALFLFRDRAGVKPLYYYAKEGRLAFGSELKSFKYYLTKEEQKEIDTDALSEFLSIGYISRNLSILKAVKKLPPGHYLKFQNGEATIKQYWSVSFQENRQWLQRKEDDLLDELDELVQSAFRYRMVADVPVGVFLSAGVDSSLVTAVLTKHYGQLRTFTIGFKEKGFDESGDAKKIAEHLGSIHTEKVLTQQDAYDILDRFYDIYDEPHGDNSCVPTTFVSGLAKQAGVKVVLSADAGDELFGGYERYTQYIERWGQLQKLGSVGKATANQVVRLASKISPGRYADKLGRFSDVLSKEGFINFYQTIIRQSSAEELKAVFPSFKEMSSMKLEGNILNQMCEWDFKRYMVDDILSKVDRATMYHSIEGREPFLDHRLVEFAAQLPVEYKIKNGQTKYLLKKLLGRYLPHELYNLPKRGFGAPLQLWIKQHYHDQFNEVLGNTNGIFDKKEMTQLLQDYNQGKEVNYILLWYLFSFQLWYQKWTREN
ncbi:MAG: asparagine synthase (glutamine-hydrolyzing) [Chitinophagaceae bacterium]|nr:MAG: asparagine synthase (glutamine-hydrolyzing) [Chitinophagaceae bacterium]